MVEAIKAKEKNIVVVGLGYVGLPLAVSFSKHVNVIGFDVNAQKVQMYKDGIDVTNEVGDEAIKNCSVEFTCDPKDIKRGDFIIVAVPTPTDEHRNPDLTPVIGASKFVGQNLKKGAIVVYESTVYPGVTEDECVPVLERESGLRCGVDFKVGYSPERINPGDKVHRFETIVKIVSGMDEESLDIIAGVYEIAVQAGVYRASSIKVAEAAKVIENSQRDINIAFVNELSKIFNIMGIDTIEVLKAAGTKWNFLNFRPGLVGGHCIGVDPYYLTYKAQELGYQPEVILAGRRINDSMGKYVAENIVKLMIKDGTNIKGSNVAVLGVTFKENVPDVRNSKVADIVHELMEYEVNVSVVDPYAVSEEVEKEYGFGTVDTIGKVDAVVLAVAHDEYKEYSMDDYRAMLNDDCNVLVDVKGLLDPKQAQQAGLTYWRL
ncbi:MAG: nucleotide sugar dehydrogenase [Clostridia bacterium]|nr:nucleotide sugar dehydrogenase [Clostridia bacterium]